MEIGGVISISRAGVKNFRKNTEQKIIGKETKELFKKISKSLAKLRMLDKNYTGGNTLSRLMSQKQEIEAMLDNKRIIGQNDKNVDPKELVYPNGTFKLEITEEEFGKLSVKNIRDLYKTYRILEIYLNSVIEAVNNKLEGLKSTAEIKKLKKAINELKKLKRDCEELLKSLKKLVNRFIKFNKSSNINNSSKNHEVKTNNKKPGTIEDEDEDEDEDDGEIGDKGEDDEKSEEDGTGEANEGKNGGFKKSLKKLKKKIKNVFGNKGNNDKGESEEDEGLEADDDSEEEEAVKTNNKKPRTVEDKGEDVDDDDSKEEGEYADDDDSEDKGEDVDDGDSEEEGEDADGDDSDEDVEVEPAKDEDEEGSAIDAEEEEEEDDVPPPPPLQPEDEAHKETSEQLGMTTEKNSPKRSEPKVKRPTPNLDVFEKSVRSYQEWLDTTFKDITDKQEEIQSVAEALFGESNKALRNSLLERTNAVVRKLLEEKERLERIIFKDEHGDKNAVRRLNRYQELYNALKPILKYAIDKLDKILAEIEKMQNGTSTSSESSSMAPPPPSPLEDDAGEPPLVPPKDDVPPPMTPDQAKEIIEGAKIVMNEGQPSNDSGWWGAFCGGVKSAINLVGRLFKGNGGSLDEEQAIELEELKEKTVQVSSIVDMTNRAKELLDKLEELLSKISEKSDSLQVPRKLVMRINLTIKGLKMNLNEVNSGSDIDAAERKAKRLSNAVERAGKVYEETSEQLGMTTEKNSPKRSEPKVKLPTPNLDDFKKSVLSSKEWIDTTFKNITDKQEEIQSVAEALFGESNKALRNSLLERTNAVVRKLLEEKERLERIIFKDEYGDKNVVRMSDRFRRLCGALEFPVKFANGKLNEISAEIAKMPNETSTSSESGSMVPPTPPPPLEDDAGEPPPIPPKDDIDDVPPPPPPEDDIDDVPPPPPPEDDIDDVPPPPPEDDSNEVTFQDQEDSSSKNKHKKGIVAKLREKFENKGGIAKAAGRRKILADAVFEINKDIKIVINKCDELLMRSEGSTDPKLKREILDLREKFLNGEKDISRKIFGNKEVSDLINSKKLSDKLLWKVQNYMLDVYYLFEGINSELNRISQKMDVHEMHDASKSLWLKPPKFEPPPLDANDPKLTEDWINYVTDFFKKSNGQ